MPFLTPVQECSVFKSSSIEKPRFERRVIVVIGPPSLEPPNELGVGRGELHGVKLLPSHPSKLLTELGPGVVCECALEEMKLNRLFRVVVRRRQDLFADGRIAAELLANLANQ